MSERSNEINKQANEAFQELTKSMDAIIQAAAMAAKIQMHYYEALRREGFNDEQAMLLLCAHGANPGKLINQDKPKQ